MLRQKYGATFDPLIDPDTKRAICPLPDWKIEAKMVCCSEKNHPPGWLGKSEHFLKLAAIVFAFPGATRPFQCNPNVERIIREYFNHKFLAVAGHGGSGKTEAIAIIAVLEFLIDPLNTAILVTSTTIQDARGRVWGRIEHYWQNLCQYFGSEENTPGELVSSSAIIRYKLGGRKDDTRGIKLIPGKESEVREGIGRMKGFHARRVRFLADELSDLSHKLLDAAKSNLFTNPDFRMVATFNPSSYFDPAGIFSEPENKWGSIDLLSSDGWKTALGWCIRFDGETSPNILLQKMGRPPIWEGLLRLDEYNDAKKINSTTRFLEQYRGCWSETGHEDSIYSNAEIIKAGGMGKVEVWTQNDAKFAGGFDPSFTHGGDRCVLVTGKCGRAIANLRDLVCSEVQEVVYLDDDLDTSKDKNEQIVAKLKSECQRQGLDPTNLAMDATGAGYVFATLMARDPFFSNKFMKVQFGGEGSEMVSSGRKGSDRFANMVSELWYAGKALLRMGQIKGLKPDIMNEMTKRLYTQSSGSKNKIRVEAKSDMKKRLAGKSPDIGDAFFLMLHACRSRLGLNCAEVTAKSLKKASSNNAVDEMFAWGVRKKKRPNQDEGYVPSGGGWADEGAEMWSP